MHRQIHTVYMIHTYESEKKENWQKTIPSKTKKLKKNGATATATTTNQQPPTNELCKFISKPYILFYRNICIGFDFVRFECE